jgi:hypothetical protein
MEVIVGDDADEGAAIASEFDDARLRYEANPERLGMAGNWNRLCDMARGDYLLLLNDDDRLLPGFVGSCVSAFHRMPDLGVVFTNHFFDRDGRWEIRRCELPPGRHEDFSAKLLEYNPVPVSASLFRRTAWEQARTLPDTGSADLVLWGRIAERGWPFFYVGDPLMVYLPHAALPLRRRGRARRPHHVGSRSGATPPAEARGRAGGAGLGAPPGGKPARRDRRSLPCRAARSSLPTSTAPAAAGTTPRARGSRHPRRPGAAPAAALTPGDPALGRRATDITRTT